MADYSQLYHKLMKNQDSQSQEVDQLETPELSPREMELPVLIRGPEDDPPTLPEADGDKPSGAQATRDLQDVPGKHVKSHVVLPQLFWLSLGTTAILAHCLAFLSNQTHCLLTVCIYRIDKRQSCQQSVWVTLGRAKPALVATHWSYADLSGAPSWPQNGRVFVAKRRLHVSSTCFDPH